MQRLSLGLRILAIPALAGVLAACDPLTLTALAVGAGAGVQHTMSGIAYKTFSSPMPKVRTAVNGALTHMDIKVGATEKIDNGVRIKARAADRDIEIELEALTSKTTRMRSTARNGIFMDSATATEIILQTEKQLGAT
jgi:uncharacterized protein DUF3568